MYFYLKYKEFTNIWLCNESIFFNFYWFIFCCLTKDTDQISHLTIINGWILRFIWSFTLTHCNFNCEFYKMPFF